MKLLARYAWLFALTPVLALVFVGGGAAAAPVTTDLKIVKVASPDPVTVGTPLTYTLQVANLGPDAATGVVVTDSLPKGVDLASAVSVAGPCVARGSKVSCELGGIGAPAVTYGGTPTATIVVIPRQAGTIVNTASVKGDQKDPVAANNKATATTHVIAPVVARCHGVVATIVGTAKADTITGTAGRDVIAAFRGDDTVVSGTGRDLVCAGGGSDHVSAGPAADRLYGGAGRDRLSGRGGADLLRGNAGNDFLIGGPGDDRLRGGSGSDRCRGAAGATTTRGCER